MDYRNEVRRTCPGLETDSERDKLSLGVMGLCGEAGEVADLVKKTLFHGKALDREKLLKELGDVRWYFEYLLIVSGFTMEEVEAANAAKTRARYPNGFNYQDANLRRDEPAPEGRDG